MRTEEKFVIVKIKRKGNWYKIGDILYKVKGGYQSDRMTEVFGNIHGLPTNSVHDSVEIVPFEIYNSTLFKIMNEVDDDTVC